jgi:hypothetical protein
MRVDKKVLLGSFIFIFCAVGAFWYAKTAYGVTRTWDGGGSTNNWTECANWSSDTCPTASDVATFDGTSTKDATINGNISVAGIAINSGYTGTITQSGANTITVGTSGWTQADGNFQGGSGSIAVSGSYSLSGGMFVSTSGTYTQSATTTISAGTFSHGSGTVSYTGGPYAIDVNSTTTFNNLTFNSGSSQSFTMGSGDAFIILGTVTITDGALQAGILEARGNVSIGSADGGSVELWFTGGNNQTYTRTGNEPDGDIRIDKTGGVLTLNSNAVWNAANQDLVFATGTLTKTTQTIQTNDFTMNGGVFNGGSGDVYIYNSLTLNAGVFTAPSGLLRFDNWTYLTIADGVTYNHNNGTLYYFGNGSSVNTISYLNSTVEFYNVRHNEGGSGGGTGLSGNRLVVLGQWWQDYGNVRNGIVEARGSVLVDSGTTGGTATLEFTGTGDQYYNHSSGNVVDGDITINKPSGSVILQSNAVWNFSGQGLTITSGTLQIGSTYNLSTGALTVGAAGELIANGSGIITLGGNVTNNGLIDCRGNNMCGGSDVLTIQSSSNGVQRSWSGSGETVMYDVTVRDQGGTLPITLYSSTNLSNNAANWTFSSAQCPFNGPVFRINSGQMRIESGRVIVN